MQKCSSVLHLIIFIFLRIFSFSSLKEKRKYFITTFIIWNTIWFIIQSIRENWKEQDVLLWCSDPYFTFHYKILTSEFQVWYQILDHGYQFVSYQFVNPQWRFPGGSDSKGSLCNARNTSSIPGSGISPGERHDNPLHHSCLVNPVDREAWWATTHGVTKSWTQVSN